MNLFGILINLCSDFSIFFYFRLIFVTTVGIGAGDVVFYTITYFLISAKMRMSVSFPVKWHGGKEGNLYATGQQCTQNANNRRPVNYGSHCKWKEALLTGIAFAWCANTFTATGDDFHIIREIFYPPEYFKWSRLCTFIVYCFIVPKITLPSVCLF